jgi:hypothetical protein
MKHAEFMQTLKDMTFQELADAYLEAKVGREVTLIDHCPQSIVEAVQELEEALFAQIETLKAINP